MSENINKVTPLLISGIGRSGTSALLKALAEHKEVFSAVKIGEAPFVSSFLNFLVEFENRSPMVDYNLANYRLNEEERKISFSNFIMSNQCGSKLDLNEPGKKFWIAKTSLSKPAYEKALELFDEVRIVYIMRNGIEVINSARNFSGFSNLSFEEHCQRWKGNIEGSEYLFDLPMVSVVKHDQLVANPQATFQSIYKDLKLSDDTAPADFINTNLFNSSFDETTRDEKAKENFKNRLKAWDSWNRQEQDEFVEICDELMSKYDFTRPYTLQGKPRKDNVEIISSGDKSLDTSEPAAPAAAVKPVEHQPAQNQKLVSELKTLIAGKITPSYYDYVCNVSPTFKYLFVNVPKVASTSLLGQMQLAENEDKAQLMANVHDRGRSPLLRLTNFDHDAQREIMFGDSYKRISIVRNPFSRILSAYLSKISKPLNGWKVNPNHPEVRPPKADILAVIQGKSTSEITDMSPEVSFEEFLAVVESQKIVEMDIHWKPQNAIVYPDDIEYDFIGRMEEFSSSFNRLAEVCGITSMEIPTVSRNHTGSTEKLLDYYSSTSADKVAQLFEADFEKFGYITELKNLAAA